DEDNATPEETWPKALQLRPSALLQQTDLIRALCRDGIRIVETTLITQHAWPELHQGTLYRRQVLSDAVKSLRTKKTEADEAKQEGQYKALQTRIARDEKFVKFVGKWVVDRLSHHRGQIQNAASDYIAIFQLGIGDVCAQRVQALVENDVYVYPGQWASDKDGKPVWMVRNSVTDIQIYHNSGLINLIKTGFFNSPLAFRYKFKKHYVSSHPDRKEAELTIPIVALAATAFFAALYEWREGKKVKTNRAKAEKFEGDNFKKVYDRHVETLSGLKKKVNAHHQVMSSLYSKVTDNNSQADTSAFIKGSALAVLDLDGLD
ncbi:hypothetical protein GALMADRAFT_74336, partial [Galerina marginata CBS 339.88]